MSKDLEILIIGAGLAGLNAAIHLQSRGANVRVVESSDRPGGRVASDVIDGFICDRGFQLINANYPALKELNVIEEIDFLIAPRVIEVAIDTGRHLIGDPRKALLSAFDSSLGSLFEKFSLLTFIYGPTAKNEPLSDALIRCGLTYERVLRPFLQGVFLTDPKNVDAKYGQQILRSFASGSIGIPKNGVGQLSHALAKRVSNITYDVQVDRIAVNKLHTSHGVLAADKIIVATDATTAAQLLGNGQVPKMAGCITWYHAVEVNPSGSGRLVVDGLNRGPVINSVVISDISKNYAPKGWHLMSTTTGLNVTESDVRRHLALIWSAPTHDWQLIAKYEIPAALPIQSPGRGLSQELRINDQLYVVGDHRMVPSQQGALFSGRLVADLIFN
uniref:FAD-dependent oxidoreductase n=1 Tax=Candidatus Planktophila sp. TaxID=2175601 RepID=UPI00404ACAD4